MSANTTPKQPSVDEQFSAKDSTTDPLIDSTCKFAESEEAWLHRTLCDALGISTVFWPQVRARLAGGNGAGECLLDLFNLLPGE